MNKSNLRYIICPGSHPGENFQSTYDSIYDCWQSVWSEAYREMKFESKLYSDAFTRQDYIGAIFNEDKCLALCFFRWANSSAPNFSEDSYFSYWNKEDISKLKSKGSQIIIPSFFTIHPLARKGNLDFSMKDLLTGISVEFFMNANADAMAANLRVDKKVNAACAKWGADLIRSDVHVSGGICGDLMVFYKDHVQKRPYLSLEKDVKQLWHERFVIPKKLMTTEAYFINPNPNLKVA